MDIAKYIAVIPGILYGMALVELIKIYRHKTRYWESSLLAVVLLVTIIYDKYKTFPFLHELFSNMAVFTVYLIVPLIFMHICYTLTPTNEHDEAREHFFSVRKKIFTMLAIFTFCNILIEWFVIDDNLMWLRMLGVVLYGINAIYDMLWMRKIVYVIITIAFGFIYYPHVVAIFE